MLFNPASIAWNLWRSRRLSVDELQDLRNRKLRLMIRHAFERVPYYRALFTSAGLSPEDVQTTEDLKKIPVSAKEDLTAAGPDKFLAQGTDKGDCSFSRTSGSSGKPFSTYFNRRERMTRRLLGLRRLVDAGFRPWDRVCVMCDPGQLRSRRFRTRCLPATLPVEEQFARLRAMQPTVLLVWPTVLGLLLYYARRRSERFIRPRIVAVTGEECSDELRRTIESDLGAEVFSFYNAGEFGPIASECRAHQGLHVNADQMIVEFAPDAQADEPSDILITSLYSFTMPYIRYRIGDAGFLEEKQCPCGSCFPRLRLVEGRNNNIIHLPGERMFSASAVVSVVLRPFPTLRKFHLIQETADRLVLQAVFLEPPTAEILAYMQNRCLHNNL